MNPGYFFLFFVLLYFVPQSIRADQEHSIMRDQYVYETASEMYAVADTLPFNKEAALLVEKITIELKRGKMIEDEKVWKNLQKLEPYRMSNQIPVKHWVEIMKQTISAVKNSPPVPMEKIKDISRAYQTHDFDGAIELSRRMLLEFPKWTYMSHAVCSNMALALMHQNKDLCALVELECIKELEDAHKPYIPAMINLTVVYERMGRSKDAESLSRKLLDYVQSERVTIPLVNFNAAWYMDLNNDASLQEYVTPKEYLQEDSNIPSVEVEEIETFLSKFELYNSRNELNRSLFKTADAFDQSEVEKYQTFMKHLRFDYQSRPVNEIGWMGKLGFFGTDSKRGAGILIFIFAGIVLWLIYRAILGHIRDLPKPAIWLLILVMLGSVAFYCVKAWGITEMGLFFSIFYLLVFFVLLLIRYIRIVR